MPGGNGTGPTGMGPMTGRGAGFCAGFGVPGYANPVGGRGYGMGFGRGRGIGRGRGFGAGFGFGNVAGVGAYPANAPFVPTVTAVQELEGLKQQAELLQNNLGQISERIEQLEKENKK
ncbi:MAG: DUF5320 domain-containing protein [Anaerohalosphaeraceae bacterium]|nr:DUF5320 domain-containing protein [Anaerohalosphaeraceae bacterium]